MSIGSRDGGFSNSCIEGKLTAIVNDLTTSLEEFFTIKRPRKHNPNDDINSPWTAIQERNAINFSNDFYFSEYFYELL